MDQHAQGGMNEQGGQDQEFRTDPAPVQKKPSNTILLAAAIVVLAIILANATRTPSEPGESPTGGTSVEETGSPSDGSPASTALPQGYLQPEDFEDRERAEAIVNRTQGKEPNVQGGERIVFGVIEDMELSETYYFATTSIDLENNFVGVYSFESATGRWHRLIKATYRSEDGRTPPTLHVVGKSGNSLLVLKDDKLRTAGPCDSSLLLGDKEGFTLYSLDLDDPLDGLKRFELPANVRDAEEAKVAACEA